MIPDKAIMLIYTNKEITIMTNSIIEIKAAITTKQAEISEIKSQIDNFEYESSDAEYDEMLDCGGEINVNGLSFYPSDIIKNCDPIAYRCGKSDYDGSFDVTTCEEYSELIGELEELGGELSDLQEELSELEDSE